MKLINTDGKECTTEELLNSGYIKVGGKTYCEYWKKGDTIETFNTVEVGMYTEALNENQDKLNKNRLKKIHRLKRENRTLSDRRQAIEDRLVIEVIFGEDVNDLVISKTFRQLYKLSEQIGKNSAKIQRLRTLISQSKN